MNKQDIIKTAQCIIDTTIVIDTETTGLGENDTVIEIAAINPKTNEIIINELVIPNSPMNESAQKVHGISELAAYINGRGFRRIAEPLILSSEHSNRAITSFNREFDCRLIMQSAIKDRCNPETLATLAQLTQQRNFPLCIMELANRYFHWALEWDYSQAKFNRLSLAKCLELTGIEREGDAHRALSDAKAAVALLQFIAKGK